MTSETADVSDQTRVTADAAAFMAELSFAGTPEEAVTIGLRCVIDGVGLYEAGLTERSTRIVNDIARDEGGRAEALLLGAGSMPVPKRAAARTLGTSAHDRDFDDTQVSDDPRHI